MYVSNLKGGVQIKFQESLYDHRCTKTYGSQKIFFYRCTHSLDKTCPATLLVFNKQLYCYLMEHNHELRKDDQQVQTIKKT